MRKGGLPKPARQTRPRTRWKAWLFAALVLAAGVHWGLPRAREYARHGVDVTLDGVVMRSAGAALVGGDARVRLRVRNATLVPVRVREVRYRVFVGGRYAGRGSWTPPGGVQYFGPGGEVLVVAAVDPAVFGVMGAMWDRIRGRDTPISVQGEVVVDLFVTRVTVEFEVRRVRRS